MAQYFEIHPENPQLRLIRQAVEIVRSGGVIVYPTDSSYALGCHIGDKHAIDRIRQIRRLDEDHNFTLVCRDISEVSAFVKIENDTYRLLKAYTPGPYTFLLAATREVPRRLQHQKRKTIGLRLPDHTVARALLGELGEPLMSSTLWLPQDQHPQSDPREIRAALEHQVELVIDGGPCGLEPTTVVDLVDGVPVVVRRGKGDVGPFES
ncbi:MAG: L-threonylcarbamoyladenylate synthase [Gammaproteobacteria bacterium]|nr:L-threonylcarbamoyladenylate synthase [Gammaproteobacteria bacterium]